LGGLITGEAGVTLKIDDNGDGIFERTIISVNRLVGCQVAVELLDYELIYEEISEMEFEYTFRVLARNSADQDIKNIMFKLDQSPGMTSIIDGIAYFSIIEPNEEILSDDSIKIRSNSSFDALKSEFLWQACKCIQRSKSDFNHDWHVDFLDLVEFTGKWLQSCSDLNWCQGIDLNHSTVVDFTDFAIFSEDWLWKIIPADFDIDEDVDFSDYALFAGYWMNKDCAELAWCEGADLDKDGRVNFLDLKIFAEHWLEGISP